MEFNMIEDRNTDAFWIKNISHMEFDMIEDRNTAASAFILQA